MTAATDEAGGPPTGTAGDPRSDHDDRLKWVIVVGVGVVLVLIVASAIAVAALAQRGPGEDPPPTDGGFGQVSRCLELDVHDLSAPDERGVRITGPTDGVPYPGYIEGRFSSLGDTESLWLLTYPYDAERYWPAPVAIDDAESPGAWRTDGEIYLGEPNQSGKAFDVLVAVVQDGSEADMRLTGVIEGDTPFEGWWQEELPTGLNLQDCARMVRR